MSDQAKCELCGEPMPPGEEMFKIHGYSGDCPQKPIFSPAQPASFEPLTPGLAEEVQKWLDGNSIEPHLVRWGRFPLGMVRGLIERAKKAEKVEG